MTQNDLLNDALKAERNIEKKQFQAAIVVKFFAVRNKKSRIRDDLAEENRLYE